MSPTLDMLTEAGTARPLGLLQESGGTYSSGGTYFRQIMQRNPVAYWRLGEINLAAEIVASHHGEFVQTPTTIGTVSLGTTLVPGDPSPSLVLGAGCSVAVLWDSWMDHAEFSFEGVFEITGVTTFGSAVVARSSFTEFCWGILLEDDQLMFVNTYSNASMTLANGIYHFVVTGDVNLMTLYLNGVETLTIGSGESVVEGGGFSFGTTGPGYFTEAFPGRLDEFVYYDFKLAPHDVYADWLIWSLGQNGAIDMVESSESARELMPSFGHLSYRTIIVGHGAWAYWAHPAFISLTAYGADFGDRGHDATVTGSPSVWETAKIGPTQPSPDSPNLLQNPSELVSQDDFTSSECTLSVWVAVEPKSGSIATEIPLVCMAPSAGASTFDKCLYLDTSGRLNWLTGTGGSVEVITDPSAFPQDGVARHVAVSVGPAGSKIRVSGTTVVTGANTSSSTSAQKIFYFNGGTGGGHDFTVSGAASRKCWVQASVFDDQLSDDQTDEHWSVGRSIRSIETFWGLTAAEVLSFGSHNTIRSGRTDHFTTSNGILLSDPQLKSLAPTEALYSSILGAAWSVGTGFRPNREIRHVYWQPSGLSGTQVICGLIERTDQFIVSPSSTTTVNPRWRVVSIDGDLTFIGMSTTNVFDVQDTFTHSTPIVDGKTNAIGFELNGTAIDLWVNGVKNSFTRTQSGEWVTTTSGTTVSGYEFAGTITPSPLPTTSINVMTGLVSEFLYNGASSPTSYQGGGAEYNKPERFFEDLALRAAESRVSAPFLSEIDTVFELTAGLDVDAQALTIDMVADAESLFSFGLAPPMIETLVETDTAFDPGAPAYTGVVTVQGVGEVTVVDDELVFFAAELQLQILELEVVRAPTTLTVTLSGGVPQEDVVFAIDGTPILTISLDSSGGLGPTSISVSAALGTAGDHVLSVTQTTPEGVTSGSQTFTVLLNPSPDPVDPTPDMPPVDVPAAMVWEHNALVRHWVFQDLLPEINGGIGSYVLPHNPPKMTSPHYEYAMTSRHTTAQDGKIHVFQAGNTPKEWTFTGYCSTAEQQAKMMEYRHLNRRFWIIDHRNRAWTVVMTDAQFVPRRRENYNGVDTDWGSDYTITTVVLDQNYQTPEEA